MNLRTRMIAVASVAALLGAGCAQGPTLSFKDLPPHLGRSPCPGSEDLAPDPLPASAERSPRPAAHPWQPAGRRPWRYIVVHHSATADGNACRFDRLHREVRGWDELGYHFVITNGRGGPDGAVEVGSRWVKQKWGAHCGGTPENAYNDYGIGICLVGDFREQAPSAKQLAALETLVAWLRNRWDIPADRVLGHGEAPNAATACPGSELQAWLADYRQGAEATAAR